MAVKTRRILKLSTPQEVQLLDANLLELEDGINQGRIDIAHFTPTKAEKRPRNTSTLPEGVLFWDTDQKGFVYWDGTAWRRISSTTAGY